MTPYRRETSQLPTDQPVRVYKIIAVTFLALTVALLSVVVFMSTKRATITIASKATPVDATGTVVVGGNTSEAIPGQVTSTLVTVSQTFIPTGSKPVPGKAKGQVTLHNDTTAAQTLVATTRLLTPDNVLFRLDKGVTVPAGGMMVAPVTADLAGKGGDIPPTRFTIPGLNKDKQKVIYAASGSAMSGGETTIGTVSAEDREKAEKAVAQAIEAAAKKMLAPLPDRGAAIKLESVAVAASVPIGAEIQSFTASGTARAVAVWYGIADLKKTANTILAKRSAGTEDLILPSEGDPTVTIEAYSVEKQTAALTVFVNGQATLNPDSPELRKSLFFGKSRDEVKRYVRGLDHVRSVDVKFTPVWMFSVPHVADHVTVVVKDVE